MKKKFDEEDLDGIPGDYHGGPEIVRQEQSHEIYNKMYEWSHDKYGDKTKPNFDTWIKSLSIREFNFLYNIMNK